MRNCTCITTLICCIALPSAVAAGSIVVQPGDTLSGIAARELGNAQRWHELCNLNRSAVKNCDLIRAGEVLKLQSEGRRSAPSVLGAEAEMGSEQPNMLEVTSAFDSEYWTRYFVKPEVQTGMADPMGGKKATRLEGADKGSNPGKHFSGFFRAETVEPGTYRVSAWLRAVTGVLEVRMGISDQFMIPGDILLNERWQKVQSVIAVTDRSERLFQVYERSAGNPAWEIYDPMVVRIQD